MLVVVETVVVSAVAVVSTAVAVVSATIAVESVVVASSVLGLLSQAANVSAAPTNRIEKIFFIAVQCHVRFGTTKVQPVRKSTIANAKIFYYAIFSLKKSRKL